MLKVKYIKEHIAEVKSGLLKRNWDNDALKIVDEVLLLDSKRKNIQHEKDQLLSEMKSLSKQIGSLIKAGKTSAVEKIKASVPVLKERIKALEEEVSEVLVKLEDYLLSIPNVPHELVPAGKTEEDNFLYQDWEQPMPTLPEGALPHWELAEKYNHF